jgi:hypothetical protein
MQQVTIVTGTCVVQSKMESLISIGESSPNVKQASSQLLL